MPLDCTKSKDRGSHPLVTVPSATRPPFDRDRGTRPRASRRNSARRKSFASSGPVTNRQCMPAGEFAPVHQPRFIRTSSSSGSVAKHTAANSTKAFSYPTIIP